MNYKENIESFIDILNKLSGNFDKDSSKLPIFFGWTPQKRLVGDEIGFRVDIFFTEYTKHDKYVLLSHKWTFPKVNLDTTKLPVEEYIDKLENDFYKEVYYYLVEYAIFAETNTNLVDGITGKPKPHFSIQDIITKNIDI